MGLPIDRLVVATNQNDILHRCLTTGDYKTSEVHPSISPSMDIQVSSNFERALFYAYGKDGNAVGQLMDELKEGGFSVSQGALQALEEHFDSGRVSEAETSATITEMQGRTGEILCPHSAIAARIGDQHQDGATPMVALATAHPAKFPDAVEAATGHRPGLPPRMADLFEKDERVTRVENDLEALKAVVKDRIAR